MHLQVAFLVKALQGMTIDEYFVARTEKYSARGRVTPLFSTVPTYFASWLSGFIEAEGSFAIRSGSVGFSFSISQTYDLYLICAIRDYFLQQHLTVQAKKNPPFYLLEIANAAGVERVVKHCGQYPLLGHKYYQLAKVVKTSVRMSHLRSLFYY